MNKISKTIFERAYQSYLCGGDVYTYKFDSNSNIMLTKYNNAIKYLEENNLIKVKFRSEDKVKVSLTEKWHILWKFYGFIIYLLIFIKNIIFLPIYIYSFIYIYIYSFIYRGESFASLTKFFSTKL